MTDTITLPREVVELALEVVELALEVVELSSGGEPIGTLEREAITALRTALAAEQPKPTDKDSLTVQSRLDAESFREERDEARALLNGVLQDIEALRRDAYQGGWLREWLDSNGLLARAIRGESLAGYEHPDIEALRRDAERYRWGVENARWVRHEHEAYVAIPVAVDADLSCTPMRTAAIDAAMGDKR